jgi:excisionase family DNA binding protein
MTPTHTVKEAAGILKLSVGHVRHLVSRGQIPHRKLGRSVRFTDTDLQIFLDKHMVKTAPKVWEPNR